MIKKFPRLIITFFTTRDAMAFEEYCHGNDIPGRLIPLPGEISAGCGLAWSAPPDEKEEFVRLIPLSGVTPQGIYDIVI